MKVTICVRTHFISLLWTESKGKEENNGEIHEPSIREQQEYESIEENFKSSSEQCKRDQMWTGLWSDIRLAIYDLPSPARHEPGTSRICWVLPTWRPKRIGLNYTNLSDIVRIAILRGDWRSGQLAAIETFGHPRINGSNSFSICRMAFSHDTALLESSLVFGLHLPQQCLAASG